MSERTLIVESTQFGNKPKPIHVIAQIIKQNKNKKLSFLDLLIRVCNCKLNKKHQYITDPAGRVIKVSQLFECLGIITTGPVRCICKDLTDWDILPYHFEDHRFSLDKICKLFERNFTDWQYTNGQFRYLGEKIDEKWKN